MIVPRFCRDISGGGRFFSGWGSPILWSTVLMLLLLCGTGGCATHVSPPSYVRDPTTVYLTNYGRHASLILPTAPGTLTEYSYGDWTFYAEAKTTPANAIAALFWSRQSALGRRSLAEYQDPAQLARDLKAVVQAVRVERDAVSALSQRLEERYAQHLQTEIYNPEYQTYFVVDDEHYGLCNNSNMLTARWLGELGCTVRGPAVLSNFTVEKPSSSAAPAAATCSTRPGVKKQNQS
jgi:hypothetical protein